MLHAVRVANATPSVGAGFGALVPNSPESVNLPNPDDLGPIEVFRIGDNVVFVDDPTGPVWQVRDVTKSGGRLLLARPKGLQAELRVAYANDVVKTSRTVRSPVAPADPTEIVAPAADKPAPLRNYFLIGFGVIVVLGLGIAAARRIGK
jgi:hypothetical protein